MPSGWAALRGCPQGVRKTLNVRILALSAALSLAAAGAQARPRPTTGRVEGQITAVDAVAVPPTVTIGSVRLNITSQTRIEAGDEEHGTLADLVVGTDAEAKYEPATLNALKIEVSEDEEEDEVKAEGTVVAADSVTGQVMLDVNGDGVVDVTLATDSETELRIGRISVPAVQIGLLEGLRVKAEYHPVSFLAAEISAEAAPVSETRGTVAAVDTAAGTLTVTTQAGDVAFVLLAGTEVRMGGRPAALSSLRVGDAVAVQAVVNGDGTRIAMRIDVAVSRPRNLHGALTAAAGSTLSVQSRDGEVVVLTVDAATDLRLNGRAVTVAALAALLAEGRSIKISAHYFERGAEQVAYQVRANARGRR